MHSVQHFGLARFDIELDRIIGDSQVSTRRLSMGVVELEDGEGRIGTGFFHSVIEPLPSLDDLRERFRYEYAERLIGADPFGWNNRVRRPRGGNMRISIFDPSVEQAMWDLQGQILGIPLYALLGGRDRRVPAYASGLEFHLDDDEVIEFYLRAKADRFTMFKVKVGHPDLDCDLRRLQLVRDTVGEGCQMMADANEAWSPKEAIRRLRAYEDAGIALHWIEDPCLRDDAEGLRTISRAVPTVLVNGGEYLDLSGKRRLIETGAVDIVNVHGSISDGLRIGWLAAEHGIPISIGNTNFEIGVHIGAALGASWIEYSYLSYNHLLETPVEFRDGYAFAPDRPGHGLRLCEAAREEFARSDPPS